MYKVERNVPLPDPMLLGGGAPRKYPWLEMEVGDSFFVPCDAESIGRISVRLRSAAAKNLTLNGRKFAGRRFADGVRVWRVK